MPASVRFTRRESKRVRRSKYIALSFGVFLCCMANAATGAWKISAHGNRSFSDREIAYFMALSDSSDPTQAVVANRLTDSLIARDFLFARIDSIVVSQSHARKVDVYLDEGALAVIDIVRWHGDSLRAGELSAARSLIRQGAVFRWSRLDHDVDLLLSLFENSGYPFARIEIDKVSPDSTRNTVDVWLRLASGPLIVVDFIAFSGARTADSRFLQRETRLREGTSYSSTQIERARRSLQHIEFVRRVEPASIVVATDGSTGIRFEIEEAPATRIDAVAGYVPASDNLDATVTGLVNLDFLNLFGTGRKASVHWNRSDRSVQTIEVAYREPWIFGWPITVQGEFGQRIEDTMYVQRKAAIRLDYSLTAALSVWGGLRRESTVADSSAAELLGVRRATATFAETGVEISTFDHPTNPRDGVRFNSSVEAGTRVREDDVADVPGGSYDVKRISSHVEVAREIAGNWVAYAGAHSHFMESEEPRIATPDLFRLGGARSLRGYREEQFLGSRIGWASLELRYRLGEATRVFAFGDYGGAFNEAVTFDVTVGRTIYRHSVGAGMRLESPLGIWGVDYAIGQEDRLLNGKVHISLLSSF